MKQNTSVVRSDLNDLLKRAAERGITEEELRAQRRSYVAGEAALGNDTDEAAYRAALIRGNTDEIIRLDDEAEQRRIRALKWMDENETLESATTLPPGPAFIHSHGWSDTPKGRMMRSVPTGYTWQPATEGTGAGWARPKGGELP